jgi:helix-turn-helix protein
MRPAGLHALADAADALARLAREAAQEHDAGGDALVSIREAARIAVTSPRVVREAVRNGELVAYGRARDRAVRRNDLDSWIASREVKPVRGVEDLDIERRMARLAGTAAPTASRTRLASTGDSARRKAKTMTEEAK